MYLPPVHQKNTPILFGKRKIYVESLLPHPWTGVLLYLPFRKTLCLTEKIYTEPFSLILTARRNRFLSQNLLLRRYPDVHRMDLPHETHPGRNLYRIRRGGHAGKIETVFNKRIKRRGKIRTRTVVCYVQKLLYALLYSNI